MKFIHKKLVLLSLALITAPSYAESFSAKRVGQGFTAITQDFTSSLSNPALLSKYDNDDDLYFSLNIGGMGSDEYELIDTAERIGDNLDALESDIDNLSNVTAPDLPEYLNELYGQAGVIVDDLVYADKKLVTAREGLNLQLIIPNKYISFGIFSNQYGKIGVSFNYDVGDESILNEAIRSGDLDQNDLQSSATGVGYSVSESGIMLAYQVISHPDFNLNIGTKLKYQRLDLFYNTPTISDIDDDEFDLTDDEYLTESNDSNIDLGLYLAWGENREWNFALVTNNLLGHEVSFAEQDLTFSLDTTSIAGFSYQNSWLTLATEIDLTDREQFIQLPPAQYAAFGAEFRLHEHMQFRLGVRSDLNDNEVDIYTVGLGISPWDVFSFDIAVLGGDRESLGAAIELGIKM
jgi:hypothetical protein